jgi:hypothetical protein
VQLSNARVAEPGRTRHSDSRNRCTSRPERNLTT